MKSNIVFGCTLSSEVWGVYTRRPKVEYIIYCLPITDLIGIYPKHTRCILDNTHYIELGYFFEMLALSIPEAYDIAFCPQEFIDYDHGHNLNLIAKAALNVTLVKDLVAESKVFLKKVNEKLVDFKDNAYICASLAVKAENILKTNSVKLSRLEQLQAFYDEKVHDVDIKKEVAKIYKDINKHLNTTDLPMVPDKEFLNNQLILIRNAYSHNQ